MNSFIFSLCVEAGQAFVYESYPSLALYLLFISINESFDLLFSLLFFITSICPGFKFHYGFFLPGKKKKRENALIKA